MCGPYAITNCSTITYAVCCHYNVMHYIYMSLTVYISGEKTCGKENKLNILTNCLHRKMSFVSFKSILTLFDTYLCRIPTQMHQKEHQEKCLLLVNLFIYLCEADTDTK